MLHSAIKRCRSTTVVCVADAGVTKVTDGTTDGTTRTATTETTADAETETAAKRARTDEGADKDVDKDVDKDAVVTVEDRVARVRADIGRLRADASLVLPPLSAPRFPVIPLVYREVRSRAPVLEGTLPSVILPLSTILALPTRHALPTRAPDAEYVDVRDVAGALVPAPPAEPVTLHYFSHVDRRNLHDGTSAENDFRALVEAAGWRARNVVCKDGRSFYETGNVRHHVDVMLRGDAAAVAAVSGLESASGPGPGPVPGPVPLAKEERELWVDVKALRALARGRAKTNATVVVELHAAGSLQAGQSDVFAYEVYNPAMPECATPALLADAMACRGKDKEDKVGRVYVLLDRVKLRDWVCATLDFAAPPVPYPEQSLYRMYCRDDYGSIITNVPLPEAYEAAGCGMVFA